MRRMSRAGLAVSLALTTLMAPLGLSAPAAAAPADAIPTAAWSGTISMSSRQVFGLGPHTHTHTTVGTYADLARLQTGAPVESAYQADVTLDHAEVVTGVCPASGSSQSLTRLTMVYSGTSTATVDTAEDDDIQFVSGNGAAFELWDTSAGTFFRPYYAFFNGRKTFLCGDPVTLRQGSDALSYQHGNSVLPETPLVDTDPDPDRLVGTTTYTLGTIPGDPTWDYTTYEYTVTYDLTRGPRLDAELTAKYAFTGTGGLLTGGVVADVTGPGAALADEVCFSLTWQAHGRSRSSVQLVWNGTAAVGLDGQTEPADAVTAVTPVVDKKGLQYGEQVGMKYCTAPVSSVGGGRRATYPWTLLVSPSPVGGTRLSSVSIDDVTVSVGSRGQTLSTLSLPGNASKGKAVRVSWFESQTVPVRG